MPAPFRFTVFSSVQDNRPKLVEGIEALEALILDAPVVTPDKGSVKLLSPAIYLRGATRAIHNVEASSFLVLDVDKCSEQQVIERILSPLHDLGSRFYVYTTHSYGAGVSAGLWKVRVVMPLAREVSPEEYTVCMDVIDEITGRLADRQALHPAAIFYAWSSPPECKGQAWSEVVNRDGPWVNPDHLLAVAPSRKPADHTVPTISDAELARVSADLRYRYAEVYLESFDGAVEGQQGDARTYQAACVLGDFGLELDEGFSLLERWNAEKCVPPWSREDLYKKAQNAYRYRTLPKGWRLAEHDRCDAVAVEDIKKLAKTCANKKGRIGEAGRALRAALKDKPIEPVTNARSMLEDAAWLLATNYPNARPHALSEHFKDAIEATAHKGARDVSMGWFRRTVDDKQQELRHKQAEREFEQHDERRQVLRDAFRLAQVDRTTPYTRKELQEMAHALGCETPAGMRRRWIVRKGDSLWFHVAGNYVGPYTKSEALGVAHVALAPAGLELHNVNKDGTLRQKTLAELMQRYGSIANSVVSDLSRDRGYYDADTLTLYEAPCPKRPLEPERSPLVEGWLRAIAGSDLIYAKLLDWLATCPNVKEPTCALLLWGERGTGKSLFAHAISRLWGTSGPTELQDVSGSFNSKLTRNPVVFGDEAVPEDWRGEPRTDMIRKFVQERQRTLRRKFVADADLLGSMRLIIAANSPDIIVSNRKALTNYDIEAINERFLVVHIPDDSPRRYLDTERAKDYEAVRDLTHGDALARHMLWLAENRKVRPGSRLLVEGIPGSELEMRMMTNSGLRSEVCNWIVNYILHPNKINKSSGVPVVEADEATGEVYMLVTSKVIHGSWAMYCDDMPKIAAIQRALGGLSERASHGRGRKMRRIDLDRVFYWAEINGAADPEQLERTLARLASGDALV